MMINTYIGTSGWSYDHWKGLFYPGDIPKTHWFSYYCDKFSTVELNATFYRRFKDQTYEKWYNNAPEGFKYVLKAPRLITHRKYLKEATDYIREFSRSASLLKEKLGLILLQLAPKTPYDPELLKEVVTTFDEPEKVAVEVRHQDWLTHELYSALEVCGAVFTNVDSPKFQVLDWATSKNAYIRLHGREDWYQYDYSDEELMEVVEAVKKMASEGTENIYIFFNNDFEAKAPKNGLTLRKMLDQELNG